MQVFVTTLNGKSITMNVERSETLNDLKAKISNTEGIALHQLRLISSTGELKDGHLTLDELGLQADCALTLVRSPRRLDTTPVPVFVRVENKPKHERNRSHLTPIEFRDSSTIYTFDIPLQSCISELKVRLCKEQQFRVEEQRLFLNDHPLDDDCRLDDSFIDAYSTVELRVVKAATAKIEVHCNLHRYIACPLNCSGWPYHHGC